MNITRKDPCDVLSDSSFVLSGINQLIGFARENGLEADVRVSRSAVKSVTVRLGEIDKVASSLERVLVLRLFSGQKEVSVSTSDLSPYALKTLFVQAKSMLEFVEDDPAKGLPEPEDYPKNAPNLNLFDPELEDLTIDEQLAMARRMENTAHGYDNRVRNTEESGCEAVVGEVYHISTKGFFDTYRGSRITLYVRVVASSDSGEMQAGGWYSSARHLSALSSPESIGRIAALRAIRQLGGRKIQTTEAPVIFDAPSASELVAKLAEAVSGGNIWRKRSFLAGRLGDVIASPLVTIRDDATIPGMVCSRPFDGEGVASRPVTIVNKGRLESYFLDCYSARKLGLRTTGHMIVPSNLFLEKGNVSPEEIIASVPRGLLVTEMLGMGVNVLTGDFSQGAGGLWIENGEIAFPVEEITIAGNLREMLMGVEMVGNDLEFKSSVSSPTIKINRMTIAGS